MKDQLRLTYELFLIRIRFCTWLWSGDRSFEVYKMCSNDAFAVLLSPEKINGLMACMHSVSMCAASACSCM